MVIVNKGMEKVSLPEQTDATDLIMALTVLGCSEPIKNQSIIGNKETVELFEVGFLDKHIRVIGSNDAERVMHWMLSLGCSKVVIQKLEKKEETEEKE